MFIKVTFKIRKCGYYFVVI